MKEINDSCTEKWFVFSRLPVSKVTDWASISGPSIDSKRLLRRLGPIKPWWKIFCLGLRFNFGPPSDVRKSRGRFGPVQVNRYNFQQIKFGFWRVRWKKENFFIIQFYNRTRFLCTVFLLMNRKVVISLSLCSWRNVSEIQPATHKTIVQRRFIDLALSRCFCWY